jgi:hypothetical protein
MQKGNSTRIDSALRVSSNLDVLHLTVGAVAQLSAVAWNDFRGLYYLMTHKIICLRFFF